MRMNPEDKPQRQSKGLGALARELLPALARAMIPLLMIAVWLGLTFPIKALLLRFVFTDEAPGPGGNAWAVAFGLSFVITALLVAAARLFRGPRRVLSKMWHEMGEPTREHRRQLEEAKRSGLSEWETPVIQGGLVLATTVVSMGAAVVALKFLVPWAAFRLVHEGVEVSTAVWYVIAVAVLTGITVLLVVPRETQSLLESYARKRRERREEKRP
jgi:hypothetical protein